MSDIVEWLRDRAFRKCGPTMEAIHTEQQEWIWAEEIERFRAENEELRKATTPICVGRGVIGKMAKDGAWTSENGASVIAADELFRNDPYETIEKLRAALKPFAELERIVDAYGETLGVKLAAKDITEESIRTAAAALKETGDE